MRGIAMAYEFGVDIKVGDVLVADDVRMSCEVEVEEFAFDRADVETGDIVAIRGFEAVDDWPPKAQADAPEWLAEIALAHLNGVGRDALMAEINRFAAMCRRSRRIA